MDSFTTILRNHPTRCVTYALLLTLLAAVCTQAQTTGSASGTITAEVGSATSFNTEPDVNSRSACPGTISVTVPVGAIITSVDLQYRLVTDDFGDVKFPDGRVLLVHTGTNTTSDILIETQAGFGGTTVTRNDLDFLNGLVTTSSTLNFEIHLWQVAFDQFSCTTDLLKLSLSSDPATVTVHYEIPLPANSLHFDGSDYVVLPNESAFDFTSAVTVETWFKVDAFDKEWQFLVTKGDNTWRLHRQAATDFLAFTTSGVNPNTVVSDVNVNDGQWHHAAGVYDGSALKIYIDGVLDNSVAASGAIDQSVAQVWIGHNSEVTASPRIFKGSMDEVRIWSVARATEDIAAAMNCELTGTETGLVAYYQFNQGTNGADNTTITTLTDATPNGHTGTLTGFALIGATSNWLHGQDDRGLVQTWYADVDGDGYAVDFGQSCEAPGEGTYYNTTTEIPNFVALDDCDDNNATTHEVLMWYADVDGDGYAVEAGQSCGAPDEEGTYYSSTSSIPNFIAIGDCDDTNPDAHETLMWYADADGDGYMTEVGESCGAPGTEEYYYTDPENNYAEFEGFDDCNDDPATGATVNPDATEIMNNDIDDDCDPATADKLANSLHFDGSGYVVLPNESAFDFTTAMTVEGWFKVEVFDKDWQFFVAKGDHTWRLSRSQNTNFVRFTLDGIGKNVISTVSVNDGNWHHIAGTYDGANIKLYIDGVLDATTPATGSIATDDKAVWLGDNEEAAGRQFKGSMDEVRIWNVARSAEDIAAAKDCEITGTETGLVAYYKFNQGNDGVDNTAITTLADATANGHTGTLTGFTLTGAASNWRYGADDRGLAETWYKDTDNDGHVLVQTACESPGEGYVTDFDMTGKTAGDCDDDNGAAYETLTWYADADEDGYMAEVGQNCGPINDGGTYYSDPASAYTGFLGFDDCDDDPATGAAINPGATEILDDGLDNDCDPNTLGTSSSEGAEDVCQPYVTYTANNMVYRNSDANGGNSILRLHRTDLSNNTPFSGEDGQEEVVEDYIMYVDGQALKLTHAGGIGAYWNYIMSVNIWSTADDEWQDIDFKNVKFYPDFDGDVVICDCDDTDANIGAATAWYADADGDGYAVERWACSQPVGYVAGLGDWTLGDCDDTDINVNPAATEITGNGIDDDCNATTSDFAGRPFIVTVQTYSIQDLGDNVMDIGVAVNPDGSSDFEYDFEVDWGDGSGDRYNNERLVELMQQKINEDEGWHYPYHIYAQPGVYTVRISGVFPQGYFGNDSGEGIISIEQWGDIEWKSMNNMFYNASGLAAYNATDAPDLSQVMGMSGMFAAADQFNGDIRNWDVSHVTNMESMFEDAEAFNQNLGAWDISAIVYDPDGDFPNGMEDMLDNSGLSVANYDATLAGWATLDEGEIQIPTGIALGANGLTYCDVTAHDLLTAATDATPTPGYGWTIGVDGPLGDGVVFDVEELPAIISLTGPVNPAPATATGCDGTVTATADVVFPITSPVTVTWTYDDGNAETEDPTQEQQVFVYTGEPFVTTWQTYEDFPNQSGGNYIEIGMDEGYTDGYSFLVDWGDPDSPGPGNSVYNSDWVMSNGGVARHEYSQPGVYTVKIYGLFPAFASGQNEYLRSIEQWGDIDWKDMSDAFSSAPNMAYNATDAPDLDDVTNMSFMFGCECNSQSVFNQDIGHWDVSNVTNMQYMFLYASGFHQDLGGWDVSNVTNMTGMFEASGLSRQNYEATLAGWATLDEGETKIPTNITLGAGSLTYCDSEARTLLTAATDASPTPGYGWTISGDTQDCSLVITYTGDKSVDEDMELSFTEAVTYTGEGTLTYTLDAASLEKGMSIDATGAFSWTPTQAQTGVHTLTITVSDGTSQDSETLTITVSAVNDAPVPDVIGNKEVDEDEALSFTASATDVDSETLTFSLDETSSGKGMTLTPSGNFSWTPTQDQAGTHDVTITVSDGALTDNETFTITVNAVNDPPLLAIGSQEATEDESLSFTASATDVDSETLTFSLDETSSGKGMTLTPSGNFSWTPTQDQAGTHDVTITVSDGALTDNETFTITVNAVNDAPVVTTIGNESVEANATLAFSVAASDEDSETLTFSIDPTSSAKGMTLNATSGQFNWTPDESHVGTHDVTITVSDGELTDNETFTITVNQANEVNDAPILETIGNQSVEANATLTFSASASDEDSETLTFSIDPTSSAKGMTLNATSGQFSWTPDESHPGTHDVTITVNDGELTDNETFTITVNQANEVNDAPILETIGNQSVEANATLTFSASASDEDSETLTFSIDPTSSAKGMTLNATSGQFSWTPNESHVGTHDVTITVSDGELTDNETFTITVNQANEVNDAPILETIGNQSVEANATLTFSASASDEDSETLTFSIDPTSSAKGMTLNATSGQFSWTPDESHPGTHDVTITVSDGELTDNETFTITVNQANEVNDAPILETIGNQSVEANATLTFSASASDEDSETLTFSIDPTSSAKGMTLNATSGQFNWTPDESHVGTHDVTITVSDGELTDNETFTITVNQANEVNDAPILETIGNQSVEANATLAFSAAASDEDSETLTFSIDPTSSAKGMTLNATSGQFSWTPDESHVGTHDIIITVTDGELTDSETFAITVTATPVTNQAPLLAVNTGLTALQGEKTAINNAMLHVTDEDNPATDLLFTVVALPTHGALLKNETALAPNGTFTQADIDENRISYDHDGLNSAADKFTFTVSDGQGGMIGSTDFQIGIDIILSAETGSNTGMNLYPLPAIKAVTIKIVNAYHGMVKISIVDVSGKEMIAENVMKEHAALIEIIDIGNVPVGVSLVRVAMGHQLYTVKLVKQ